MRCQGAAANPENEDQQQRLREAAEGLRVATNAAAQNAIKKKLVNRLEVSNRGSVKLKQTFVSCLLECKLAIILSFVMANTFNRSTNVNNKSHLR